ncbi:long-chain fatty acid--CoA ligase [Patescibacteria group bacterium]|nr:long-chain fatty acid--CoA ligase [Patescibacteria group bacterium]
MTAPNSIFRRFEKIAGQYPHNMALGYKISGRYHTLSYKKLLDKVNRCVTGLKKLGVGEGDKVAILSKNRPEWVQLDLALNKIGAISVPIHITLSPKYLKYIIENSKVQYLAIGDYLSKYYEIKSEINLKKVITFPKIEWLEDFIYFADLLKEEPDKSESVLTDVCSIIYTSGTTGDPKGVMLTNQNFIQNIEASSKFVPITAKDTFLSFLPLSHVLERTGGYYGALFFGAAIYYAGSYQTIAEDIKRVKPTIIITVPRLFEKFYDKVMDRVRAEKSKFKQKIIYGSFKVSRVYLNARKEKSAFKPFLQLSHFLADKFILSKIRNYLGGHLKFAICGGATLNPSTAKFFESLGIKILEGYGLTETSPIVSVNPVNDYHFNTVGKIIPQVEVKIADDKEILVKGPNIMKGYYDNKKATKQSFTKDGWFKTEDLGYVDEDGYLTIIGRKKEMIVLSTGKNVNPVDLENALQQSKFINQAMVFGDKQKHLSALIVPDFGELEIYAQKNNIDLELSELICYQPILDLIKSEIENQLKEFPDNERISKFVLLDKEFSEEREELTPTLKLRRERILENYKIVISN